MARFSGGGWLSFCVARSVRSSIEVGAHQSASVKRVPAQVAVVHDRRMHRIRHQLCDTRVVQSGDGGNHGSSRLVRSNRVGDTRRGAAARRRASVVDGRPVVGTGGTRCSVACRPPAQPFVDLGVRGPDLGARRARVRRPVPSRTRMMRRERKKSASSSVNGTFSWLPLRPGRLAQRLLCEDAVARAPGI